MLLFVFRQLLAAFTHLRKMGDRRQLRHSSAQIVWMAGFLILSLAVAVATPVTPAPVFVPGSETPNQVQVQVSPTSPVLGDTISVVVQYRPTSPQDSPTVMLGNQTFPTFAIGPNRFRTLLATSPLNKPGSLAIHVTAAGQSQSLALKLANRSFPTQSIWVSGGGSDGTDYEFDRVDAFKKLVTPQKYWSGPFRRPSQGEVTSIYGVRRYYNGKFAQDYYHRGVDYGGAYGSPVIAPAAGRVALVGRVSQGFKLHGNTIGMDHGQGVESIFLHLSRIDVKEGDFVQAGQVIGAIGDTGGATGPHLHWGLYVNGVSVDPVPWRETGIE